MPPRYREASSALKEVVLDEFVAATGYARKYAIRLLNHPAEQKRTITRLRPAHYGLEVQQALHLAWTAANHICAKRVKYQTCQEARSSIFEYIECFYNPIRLHSTLQYTSPIAYEQANCAKNELVVHKP